MSRPRIGVALGGGSARGLAHVGVLRWLEERRIPIDVLAGTSMGGLIGGAYATGMPPDEIEALLAGTDWNAMFGSSGFRFANVRRKRDLRAYPSHLEFGLKRGLVAPTSLNNGQQVDLLLARIAGLYYDTASFDELPTPFRCVAVDLRTARFVVLGRGSLAESMRATMSLPLVFPPVSMDGQVLVDGGAMNNIPADVVRDMGASRVIAVNVGDLSDKPRINASLLGLVAETLDAMMRANTLKALAAADIVINVPLRQYGSLDWRRYDDLIREGYQAAEAMKEQLLPLAVSEGTWQTWRAAREAARRRSSPEPAFVQVEGAGAADADLMRHTLAEHVGRPLDVSAVEADLTTLGGLDRYQSLTWEMVARDGTDGLLVRAHPKSYGPPFVFLGVSLENTTSNEFRFGLSGRYLAYDVLGSASELRLDAAVGSDPSAAIALYRPLGNTPFFVEPIAGILSRTFNVVADDRIVAAYRQTRSMVGAEAGINVGRLDDVRAGLRVGHVGAEVRIGDPGFPEVGGRERSVHLRWTHDGQDSSILPSRGLHLEAGVEHMLDAPSLPEGFPLSRTSEGVTQAETMFSWMRSLGSSQAKRAFVGGGVGTSFGGDPLPIDQFPLGGPLRLSGFSVGERRGDHYSLVAGGYLHQVGRLPDFVGGPVFLSGSLETGAAFDRWEDADVSTHASVSVIADTLIGPVFAGAGLGFDGSNRFYIGIGRIFR